MILPSWLVAVILGVVEGATEFLPVSSTGHLIVVGDLLGYSGEEAGTFEIVIQFGAILAVVWHYRAMLLQLLMGFTRPRVERRVVVNLLVAFLPAAVVGVLLHGLIKTYLFNTAIVAWALIVGGIIMLLLEWRRPAVSVERTDEVTLRQAFGIGAAQLLAMIPGTSRAAATILGGYAFGLSRPAATEFSFLLAIPTIVGASVLDAYKSRDALASADPAMFAIGIGVSFVVALVVIRGFLRYIRVHSFAPFAWYRIGFGALLLILISQGVV